MKKIFIIFMLLSISFMGCKVDSKINDGTAYYNKICIEGHIYYSSGHKLSIKLDDNGKLVKCEGE